MEMAVSKNRTTTFDADRWLSCPRSEQALGIFCQLETSNESRKKEADVAG